MSTRVRILASLGFVLGFAGIFVGVAIVAGLGGALIVGGILLLVAAIDTVR